ncbi:hypothetical protein HPB48_021934 [Haemaphysalis longicornis]|uniref:Guanine nucleotide-binding protein subunit gamma n=1 Tax=Haemaphysalis longicornis TaxID=44386 RepID=A0A9J6FWS2_HAELO|nr:hypothetical protein HPB48_021934 [Haemaphysalis longicornis]
MTFGPAYAELRLGDELLMFSPKRRDIWAVLSRQGRELRAHVCVVTRDVLVSQMSNLQQQRKIVEQLRREAGLKRMEVSAAVEDLKKYIQDHESDDYLLVGFHSQKANPFREKSSCSLL